VPQKYLDAIYHNIILEDERLNVNYLNLKNSFQEAAGIIH